jgi:hypothetical protein
MLIGSLRDAREPKPELPSNTHEVGGVVARLKDLTVGARASGVFPGSILKSVGWTGKIHVSFGDLADWNPASCLYFCGHASPVRAGGGNRQDLTDELAEPGRVQTMIWSDHPPRLSRPPINGRSQHSLPRFIDAARGGRDAGKLNEEILQLLATPPGKELDAKLEIHIDVAGSIGDRRVHIASKNAAASRPLTPHFERE